MYRCLTCNYRTDDIDVAPCGKDPCTQAKFQEIVTVHRWVEKDGVRTLLCNGRRLRPGTRAIGSIYGLTCIECRQKISEEIKERQQNEDNIGT